MFRLLTHQTAQGEYAIHITMATVVGYGYGYESSTVLCDVGQCAIQTSYIVHRIHTKV